MANPKVKTNPGFVKRATLVHFTKELGVPTNYDYTIHCIRMIYLVSEPLVKLMPD